MKIDKIQFFTWQMNKDYKILHAFQGTKHKNIYVHWPDNATSRNAISNIE